MSSVFFMSAVGNAKSQCVCYMIFAASNVHPPDLFPRFSTLTNVAGFYLFIYSVALNLIYF